MKSLKTTLLGLSMCGLLFFSSCSEKEQTVDYTVEITGYTFGPFVSPPDLWHEQAIVETSDLEAILNDYNASLDNVKKIEPKEITITTTAPAGANFNAIQFAEVKITAPGKDTVKIAYTDGEVADGLTSISLASQGNNIMDYLRDDQFSILVRIFNNDPQATEQTYNAKVVFSVQTKGTND
ncbi:MAG: hypothetical protein SFW35_05745 [Chitinophagales bacterium]|nr:hypothetical protein [Chitinophagales bacterium]